MLPPKIILHYRNEEMMEDATDLATVLGLARLEGGEAAAFLETTCKCKSALQPASSPWPCLEEVITYSLLAKMSQARSTWSCCPSYPNWAFLRGASCALISLSSYSCVRLTFQKQNPLFCSTYMIHFPGSHHLPFLSTGSKNGLPFPSFSFCSIQEFIKTFQTLNLQSVDLDQL